MSNSDRERRFYLCLTCGRLKAEHLFEEGDCTCNDCYQEGRGELVWRPASDGDGYVSPGGSGGDGS